MKHHRNPRRGILFCAALFLCALLLAGCVQNAGPVIPEPRGTDTSMYLRVTDDEPDTVDFQCTTLHYTVALNVFDRLTETEKGADGRSRIVPSLAESWTVSADGLTYSFRLREGVRFSNGDPLTPEDVRYTLTRLLAHPESRNREIAAEIAGADALSRGETDDLAGFVITGSHSFTITLTEPFPAFLASLSMPGASILSEKSVREAGDLFGKDPAHTIGTGSFILETWTPGEGMRLRANSVCWRGAPACAGLELLFVSDEVEQRLMFERGELDLLDLDELGDEAEYFVHGDIYQDRLYSAPQVDITYIALNESIAPLNDARVRRALQLALNRQVILDALYSGRGQVENGIFPHALNGFNPELAEIPCDPEEAARLLAEAGYPDGFELEAAVRTSAGSRPRETLELAADMWKKIGVRLTLKPMEDSEFMQLRGSGQIACYTATWSADYDDPDNFLYPFFGTAENTVYRSLCYPDEAVIRRVQEARSIPFDAARMMEYAELERKIIQEDAAWIPLFSRTHLYVTGERITGFRTDWNGWIQPCFREIAVGAE